MENKRSHVRSAILSALARGDLKVGDRLPTEAELIERYGISRGTVREGLASLVEEGILHRRRGAGTFVASVSAGRRSKMLAVMVPCVRGEASVYDRMVRGMEDVLNERGYSLVLCNHDNDPAKVSRYVQRFAQEGVSGVVYTPMMLGDQRRENLAAARELEELGLALVLIDSAISSETVGRFSLVTSNGFAATVDAVAHLAAVGHRRIGYIRGLPMVHTSEQRYVGYVEGMSRQGLEVPAGYVQSIKLGPVSGQGQAELRAMLAERPAPTAVACTHDFIAKNVMDEANRLGLRVPDDVAVVGFDDLPFVAHLDPPMTTLRQPAEEEGRRAVQILLDKIEGRLRGERQEILPCELIVRRSCGNREGTAETQREKEDAERIERTPQTQTNAG